jgi:hypothetical protein
VTASTLKNKWFIFGPVFNFIERERERERSVLHALLSVLKRIKIKLETMTKEFIYIHEN